MLSNATWQCMHKRFEHISGSSNRLQYHDMTALGAYVVQPSDRQQQASPDVYNDINFEPAGIYVI